MYLFYTALYEGYPLSSPNAIWHNGATLQSLLLEERHMQLGGLLIRVLPTPSLNAAIFLSLSVACITVKHHSAYVPALVVAIKEEEVHVLIDRVYDNLYVYVRE